MAKKIKATANESIFKKELIKMPDGYYSGDKPNPNLKKFVEEHIKVNPYNEESDDYNVVAFDKPLNATKATAIYNMHTYWSKKPHGAIQEYIKHYTKPGDLVLDPFSGSGGTALAALMEGRKAIAIDRSPAATFITKNYCTPVDTEELQKAFEELEKLVKPEIDWLYETKCDRCGGKAKTSYTVYSQVFQCPRCLNKMPLYDCIEAEGTTLAGKPKKITVCPHCHKNEIVEEISTSSEKFGAVPVLVSYECEAGCNPKRSERKHNDSNAKKREYFEKFDLGKITEIESKEIPYWYPTDVMMNVSDDQQRWGLLWRPYHGKIRRVSDFYTKRNLWALSILRNYSQKFELKDNFDYGLTSVSLALSKLQRYSPDSGFPNMLLMGTYYTPVIGREIEVFDWFKGKISSLIKGFKHIQLVTEQINISTQSATNLSSVLNNSVDYIFTDPPYADKVQYGELNFIWESWLGYDTHWLDEEIIVSSIRGKTENEWERMMRMAMAECFRVLKPGRWLSLCYHDSSEGTWSLVQDIMAEVGFIVDKSDNVLYIDTDQKSFNQITADKVTKRDLVINFRKPRANELKHEIRIDESDNETTFFEKINAIISDFLTANPGSSKDRIYDEVVSRMVRKGQMEPHNFDKILRLLADEIKEPIMKNLFEQKDNDIFNSQEISRWYLKEKDDAEIDTAETKIEDNAAKKIYSFIEKYLKDNPAKDGVHYSDIFEHYVHSVKEKPRRDLTDWLLDYLYKTEEGTYRLPASDEEQNLKADIRAKGSNRRIKRFISLIKQELEIPETVMPNNATLIEWIRQCKRSGLFEYGKILYEKGGLNLDKLSEEQAVEVEEDYNVCVRNIVRQ